MHGGLCVSTMWREFCMKLRETEELLCELNKINNLIIQEKFRESLDMIDSVLHSDLEVKTTTIFRLKALAECAIGNRGQAYETIKGALNERSDVADWHQAGEYALELGFIDEALTYLSAAINYSLAHNNDYYLSTCYLERAYIYIQLNEKRKALDDLEHLEGNESIGWLKNTKFSLTKGKLLEEARSLSESTGDIHDK